MDKHFSKSSEKKSSTKKATETEAASTPDIGDLVIKEKVTDASVRKYLGPRRYRIGLRNDINEIGICMGLAWTQVGGDLLEVEVATFPGNGKLRITGKLGEVMQESAHAAWSYVRTRADFLGLDTKFYEKLDVHIHVPEGAIPKDGPSAGICMATALTSAITGRPVNRFVAMTGEITLRGRVLPIGGLKEKLLAAHRGGIEIIVIPEDNRKDIEDIPKNILKNLTIHCVKHMDEVLIHALAWDAQTSSRKKKDDLLARLQKITAQIPGKGSSGNTVKH